MKPKYYILKGKTPEPCNDLIEWATEFETGNRDVGKTELPNNVRVSTVFLGLDHSWTEDEVLLFETMIFGGEHDEYCERYSTWEDAEAGHQRAVKLCTP